jgi:hypothetical protein
MAYLKRLDKRHIKTKKKFHLNTRPEMSGFEFNWTITFNNKYRNYVIFYLQPT